MCSVCQRITKLRKKSGLSRKAIAQKSGFAERTIAAYERGERKPTLKYLGFLSLEYGIPIDFLQNGTGPTRINPISHALVKITHIHKIALSDIALKINVEASKIENMAHDPIKYADYRLIIKICEDFDIKPSEFGLARAFNGNFLGLTRFLPEDERDSTVIDGGIFQEFRNEYIRLEHEGNSLDIDGESDPNSDLAQEVVDLLQYASPKYLLEIRSKLEQFKKLHSEA